MKAISFLALFSMLFARPGAAVHGNYYPYVSGIQVHNLEAAQAAVTLTFYAPDGTQAAQILDAIPANVSRTYFPLPEVGLDFEGSVVVEADKQISSIGNILARQPQPDGSLTAASYNAPAVGSNVIYAPLLMKANGPFETWFSVQNTGASPANIQVEYSDDTSASAANIQPGAAHIFRQADETHNDRVFSAVITGDQPLSVVVVEESSTVMFAYSGFSGGAANPYLPLINVGGGAGMQTGIQVQNAGDAESSITISYQPVPGVGTACTETQSIPAGQSKTFALYAFAGVPFEGMTTDCAGGVRFVGSAQVTANSTSQPLTVIVNQLSPTYGGAYNGFAGSSQVVQLPLIMDRNAGYFTGFNVQNVGSAETTVTCTFTGTDYQVQGTLQAGEALNALQNQQIAAGYIGSGACTAGAGGQIVAVVNELGPSATVDNLLVYEGVAP